MTPRRWLAALLLAAGLGIGGVFHFGTPLAVSAPSRSVPIIVSPPSTAAGGAIQGSSSPDGFGAWTLVSQGTDQDVVTSTALVSSNLCFPIVTDRTYEFQARLKYSASAANVGLRYNVTVPTNTQGYIRHGVETWNANTSTLAFQGDLSANLGFADIIGPTVSQVRPYLIWIHFSHIRAPRAPDPGGNVCIVFANQSANGTTRLWAASSLAYRQLDP